MDSKKPKIEAKIEGIHTGCILTLSFSPNQRLLCSGGFDKLILTNLQNNKTLKSLTGHKGSIRGSSFSSNGKLLATCSDDRTVRIWSDLYGSQSSSITLLEGHTHMVFGVQFFRTDPTKVVSCSHDKTIKIWDVSQKKVISTLEGSSGFVYSVEVLNDEDQTIVSGEGTRLRIWDIRSGKCSRTLDHHTQRVRSIQFHPNTFSLASGSTDETVKVYDLRTFQILHNFQDHSGGVCSVCFHPSGKYLLSGSRDETVKIFDLCDKKKVIYTLGDYSIVVSAQFSPDGNLFAYGGYMETIYLRTFPLGEEKEEEGEDKSGK